MKRLTVFLMTGCLIMAPKAFGQEPGLAAGAAGLRGDYPRKIVNWLASGGQWTQNYSSDCAYDETGHLLIDMRVYSGTAVETKDTYQYTAAGMVSSYARQVYQVGLGWVDVSRTSFTYDNNLQITKITVEVFDPDTGQWVLTDRTDTNYEYENGQMKKKEIHRYNQESKEMVPSKRHTYEYTNNQVTRETEETYSENSFKNTFQYNHQYYLDKPDKIQQTEQKRWRNSEWVNLVKLVYEYDNENRAITIWSMWLNEVYELKNRLTSQTDDKGNDILSTVEAWENLMWKLLSGYRNLITYQNDHAVEKVKQDYSTGGSLKSGTPGWLNAEKWEYSDFYNLGIDNPDNLSFRAECYPNPVSDQLEINWSTPRPGGIQLTMMDLQGQPIRSDKLIPQAGRVSWDLSTLPAGVYLVRLTDSAARVITRQIIKN